MSKQVIFAIDIESSGISLIDNVILSIGYCAGTIDGEILLKKRVSLFLEDRQFEVACMDEFWSKRLDVLLAGLIKRGKSPIKLLNEDVFWLILDAI